jgi:hypothetical protein
VGIPLPSEITDPIRLADWLEVVALSAADGNSSHGDLQRELNRAGTNSNDEICSDTMAELHRRIIAAGANYPFTFTGSLLSSKNDWKRFTPYTFCLLLSYCDQEKKKVKGLNHEIMFEQLSCIAARNYIGGKVLRFGFPRRELPVSFRDAVEFICKEVNEWNFSVAKKIRHHKDGGLDLVAWKEFPDQKIGKLILFGHCASGDYWDDKIHELRPEIFCSQWLGGEQSPVVKTFFIPHRISADDWQHRAIAAKLFFDRCRIAYWAGNDEFSTATRDESIKWCQDIFERLRN